MRSLYSITAVLVTSMVMLRAAAAFPEATEEMRRTYSLSDGASVTVKNVSGAISISTWDQPQADLHAVKRTRRGAGELKRVDIVVSTAGGLDIRTDYRNSSGESSFWENLFGGHSSPDVSVDITLKLPRGAQLRDISSVSGDIIVDSARGSGSIHAISGNIKTIGVRGPFDLKTVSGDITSERGTPGNVSSTSGDVTIMDAGGDCEVHTVSGDIRVERAAGNVAIQTTSGDVEVSAVSIRSASSVSGDIRVTAGVMNAPMKMSSISGDVNLRLPSTANADITFNTVSGTIENRSDLLLNAVSMSKKSISGKIGNGGPLVHVKTVSGDITLDK